MNAPIKSIDELKQEVKNTAAEFLLGEIIKASSKRFKSLAVPYMELKQREQQHLLEDIMEDCRKAVKEAVEIIASDFRVTFRASVEKVEFKADGVKAALTMMNSEEAHSLADSAGRTVMIVIEDASRYLEVGDATEGDPDQKPLFDKSQEGKK